MYRIAAIFFLLLFTASFAVNSYAFFTEETEVIYSLLEDEETHETKLEVLSTKSFIQSDNYPYVLLADLEYQAKHLTPYKISAYEDVYLNAVESPPDLLK